MIKILLVAGARPNFMKIAPIIRALQKRSDVFEYRLVHTGQHYDKEMSDVFFEELEIPKPDHYLDVGSGSHAEQTAKVMTRFEKVCEEEKPDLVIVVGDINSTLACSIVAKKANIKLAHVEAGLRSRDLAMPEEINRMVTDAISDYFFVTEKSGVENLLHEGKPREAIHFVGHVMIDNLFHQVDKLKRLPAGTLASEAIKARFSAYGVMTLHRPSNVDSQETLQSLIAAIGQIAAKLPIIFPIHPRTQANLERFGIALPEAIHTIKPQPYMDFLNLFKDARLALTDSGGLQEETTALGVPCLTLRENTERPITAEEGTNVVVGTDPARIVAEAEKILAGLGKAGRRPELWDGAAAERIADVLAAHLNG
ncbi:non-hydrolyzing UDP-N-acetylglucosamine 2-epimerase [Methylococcus sp. EFPC2]|uniref:non-hydrolyzing UDP-N-acetylglucosamine 2-epimerase n=1 Tax=Methylococcus sp. EFPC2 TaxID=2812648 RepID=UPI00196762D9|nr:UDP-N-acetylglucosamine 2-epimerase (non-hydrolyzing) [Methylococcus sp. EFPC2]QSA98939.1 UDP-N-acetylglucosamine 2-epimerase (non-hydrolyzing) [Methylococcus sp. EFPC2]